MVFSQYDYDGKVGTYQFDFNYGWEYSSIKDIEQFIQCELSKKLCGVH
jgi:hypothetical protein